MELTGFLLARVAEDEAAAREAIGKRVDISAIWSDAAVSRHINRWSSARVLAECEKNRLLVEFADTVASMDDRIQGEWGVGPILPEHDEALRMLKILALPYAEHPDYDKAWRP